MVIHRFSKVSALPHSNQHLVLAAVLEISTRVAVRSAAGFSADAGGRQWNT